MGFEEHQFGLLMGRFSWVFWGIIPAQGAPDFMLGDIGAAGCKCYGVWF